MEPPEEEIGRLDRTDGETELSAQLVEFAERRPASFARRGVLADEPVGLAAAGGILPSPTAIVVLVSTFTAHRIAFGLSLIVAFSVGLAAALVVVGIVALRARTFVARKLGGPALWILPMLSALVIVGFGVFFVARGVSGL